MLLPDPKSLKPVELQEQRDKLVSANYAPFIAELIVPRSKRTKGLGRLRQHLEDMTFSATEIDAFLPKALKRGK